MAAHKKCPNPELQAPVHHLPPSATYAFENERQDPAWCGSVKALDDPFRMWNVRQLPGGGVEVFDGNEEPVVFYHEGDFESWLADGKRFLHMERYPTFVSSSKLKSAT